MLVHGWPETLYARRPLMEALARDFQVIAVDQRGRGLSDKPWDGYDTGTLANDLVGLMDALGHQRFAVVGHDTGAVISYALAADHRDRVDRLVIVEVPPQGVAPSPPLFAPGPLIDRLWHIAFNRLQKLNEQLVRGREDIFLRLGVRRGETSCRPGAGSDRSGRRPLMYALVGGQQGCTFGRRGE